VWLQPPPYFELNAEGNHSRLLQYFGKNLPKMNYPMEQEFRSFDVALLKLIIRTIYYGDNREYYSEKLAQAINTLVRIDH